MSLRSSSMHHRSNTISSPVTLNLSRYHSPSPSPRLDVSSGSRPAVLDTPRASSSPTPYDQSSHDRRPPSIEEKEAQRQAALAQIEQVRMLILGMDQRLDTRESKLVKMLERAEGEGRRYESKVAEAQAAGVGVGG